MSMYSGMKDMPCGGSESAPQDSPPGNTNHGGVVKALVPKHGIPFPAPVYAGSPLPLPSTTACSNYEEHSRRGGGGEPSLESPNDTPTSHHHHHLHLPPQGLALRTLKESPLKWNMALQDIIDTCFEANNNNNPTPEPNTSSMSNNHRSAAHVSNDMDAATNDTLPPSSLPHLRRSPSLSGWRAVGSPSGGNGSNGNNGTTPPSGSSTTPKTLPKDNSTVPMNAGSGMTTTALPSLMRNRSYSLLHPMTFHSTPTLLPDASSTEDSEGDASDEDVAKDLQLPVSLHADIGIDSIHEMAQVFKRASICDLSIVDSSRSVDWKAGNSGNGAAAAAAAQFHAHTLTPTTEPTSGGGNNTPVNGGINSVSPGKAARKSSVSLTGHPVPWTRQRVVSNASHVHATSHAIPIASPVTSRRHSVVDALLLAGLSEQDDTLPTQSSLPSNAYTDNPTPHASRHHVHTTHDTSHPSTTIRRPSSSSSAAMTTTSTTTMRYHQAGGVPLSYFMPSDPLFDDTMYADTMNTSVPPNPSQHNHAYTGERVKSNSSNSNNNTFFDLKTFPGPVFTVEFKAGRTELCYLKDSSPLNKEALKTGTFVIVEADRGEDLGRITGEMPMESLRLHESPTHPKPSTVLTTTNTAASPPPPTSTARMSTATSGFIQTILGEGIPFDTAVGIGLGDLAALLASKEVIPKSIHRLATPTDLKLLQAKAQEEALAMVRCQSRIRQRKLPMDVVDAEYQWDRNKLTFYFAADRRIDFRELVRDLFRIYKTRIWMCAVDRARLSATASPSKGGRQGTGRAQLEDTYLTAND